MELLKKLVETAGVPGREERIRQIVNEQLEAMDFTEIRTDQIGNIIAFRAGKDDESAGARKKVMFAAHMDEIGLVVSHIDDKGFLRFQPLGGWDPRTLMSQRVIVYGKKDLPGVIGAKPAHILTEEERKKPLEIKDYFIDLGLPKEEVVKWIEVGSPVTLHRTLEELGECLTCKTFDDRVGVYCLLEALRKVRSHPFDLYAVFTSQEEVGLRGALAASSGIVPDVGIAVDITLANDVPGATPQEEISHLGAGTSICILNGSHITNPKLFKRFVELAEKHQIKYQKEVLPRGGTDAGGIQRAPGGPAVITISIPCRYAHTSVEMVHKGDIQATIDLLAAFLEDPGDLNYQL